MNKTHISQRIHNIDICVFTMGGGNGKQLIKSYEQEWTMLFKNMILTKYKYEAKCCNRNLYIRIRHITTYDSYRLHVFAKNSPQISYDEDGTSRVCNWDELKYCFEHVHSPDELRISHMQTGIFYALNLHLYNVRQNYIKTAITKLCFTTLHDYFQTMNHEQLCQITNWTQIDKILFDPYLFTHIAKFF